MNKIVFCILLLVSCMTISCISFETEAEEKKEQNRKQAIEEDIQQDLNAAKEDIGDAIDNLSSAFEGLKEKHNIGDEDPVNFRDLKEVLPKKMAGLSRENSEGQTSGILGFKISTVEADYFDDNSSFEVSIVDIGGAGKLAKKMANWTEFEVDKEGKDGYERTTEINGYPALEKYNERREGGEISLFVDDRFIISVKGDGVSERQMKRAIKDINLRKLNRLGKKSE